MSFFKFVLYVSILKCVFVYKSFSIYCSPATCSGSGNSLSVSRVCNITGCKNSRYACLSSSCESFYIACFIKFYFTFENVGVWLLVLVFLQVLILNNILLFEYATPFLYIYLLFFMDSSLVSKNQLMIWAFVLGLLVDIGANTLGMHTAATVFLAFTRPTLLKVFSQPNV